jgi:amino acid adenylation domain-containing protein
VTEVLNLDESLVAAFERVAATFPTHIAVGSNLGESSYRSLNETANRLAHRLIERRIAPGDRVAILMLHDAPLLAAVLGTLKAGAIVVALDPGDPVSRLKTLIGDSEPAVIVTDLQNRNLAAECGLAGCTILNFEWEVATGSAQNPSIAISPRQTAFLIYTSGTTGRPKGVMQSHRQLRRTAAARNDTVQFSEKDRVPLFAMLSTGAGAGSRLWSILLHGAMACPFSVKTRGAAGLVEWIIGRELTVYVSSASLFRTLAKTIDDRLVFANIRAVMLHGEPVTSDDFRTFRRHFPSTSILVHTLSSAETSNIAWARWTQDDEIPEGVLPVGHFSRDTEVSLLADDGQPVARGEIGEIAVRSRYLANGYWRDPGLTAERFSADLDGSGTRLLRTGDRGRINAEGLLEFCGRSDNRIKIRGYRIELRDVELAIERLPGIDLVAVAAVARDEREPLLVAFIVETPNASWTAARLRYALRANLPLHMVPSRIVFLDKLPYNRANKIDRAALRQYPLPVRDVAKGDEPRTETERWLAEIWAEILEIPSIGRDDDFFSLGGDSLMGASLAAHVYTSVGVELSLGAIADHPTVSALAEFIDGSRQTAAAAAPAPPIVRVPRAASMPMSLTQEAIWNYGLDRGHRASLTRVRSYRVLGPLDIDILSACLSYLAGRHEILRTTFGVVEGRPAQIIHESSPSNLAFVDLIDADDPEARADSIFRDESSRPIDLESLPIRRNVLLRIARDNYRLLRVSHPLIMDGLGSQILDAELAVLYEAMLYGKELPFPKQAELQYADYAVWQRQAMQPGCRDFDELMSWWMNLLSAVRAATPPRLGSALPPAPRDPSDGILGWKIEERVAKRLDEIARRAGATHFTIRLAAFVAAIAGVTAKSTVVIAAGFSNRNRVEMQTIVGRLLNPIHLVLSYDENRSFLQWLESVRDHVFEATKRGGVPYGMIHDQLRASGMHPPQVQCYFTMSKDHSDRRFGNLVISDETWRIGGMPRGLTIYIDERKPENCRIGFDANVCDRGEMRAMLDRYLRLLEVIARAPELPLGKLMTMMQWDAAIAEVIAGMIDVPADATSAGQ